MYSFQFYTDRRNRKRSKKHENAENLSELIYEPVNRSHLFDTVQVLKV